VPHFAQQYLLLLCDYSRCCRTARTGWNSQALKPLVVFHIPCWGMHMKPTWTTKPPSTAAGSTNPIDHHPSMHDRLCRCTSSCNATQHTVLLPCCKWSPACHVVSSCQALSVLQEIIDANNCHSITHTTGTHNRCHTRSQRTALQGSRRP